MMAKNRPLVVRGGTIVNIQTGDATPDCAILIEDGRIASLEPNGNLEPPSDAQVVDAGGAWLIPGLIDMHVHLPFRSPPASLLPLYLAHGVTTIRNVGGGLTDLLLLRDRAHRPDNHLPRLFIAGPLLDGMPPLWPDHTILVDTVPRARSAAKMLIAQGVDCIKIYNSVPRDSLEAIVEEAHEAGLPVLGHVPRSISTSDAVRIGMDCLEHIRITGRELLAEDEADQIDYLPLGTRETLLWELYDVDSEGIQRLIDLLVEKQTFLDPTVIVDADMFENGVPDDQATELEQRLPQDIRDALYRDRHLDPIGVPEEMRSRARVGFLKRLAFIKKCNEAGVRLLAGTDTFGLGGLLPGVGLHNELGLLQRAGLSPLEALRAATLTAAAALGQGQLGKLKPGAMADVVAVNANPLADSRNVRNIRFVIAKGNLYDPADLIDAVCSSSDG